MKIEYVTANPDLIVYTGPEMGMPEGIWRGKVRGLMNTIIVSNKNYICFLGVEPPQIWTKTDEAVSIHRVQAKVVVTSESA